MAVMSPVLKYAHCTLGQKFKKYILAILKYCDSDMTFFRQKILEESNDIPRNYSDIEKETIYYWFEYHIIDTTS